MRRYDWMDLWWTATTEYDGGPRIVWEFVPMLSPDYDGAPAFWHRGHADPLDSPTADPTHADDLCWWYIKFDGSNELTLAPHLVLMKVENLAAVLVRLRDTTKELMEQYRQYEEIDL